MRVDRFEEVLVVLDQLATHESRGLPRSDHDRAIEHLSGVDAQVRSSRSVDAFGAPSTRQFGAVSRAGLNVPDRRDAAENLLKRTGCRADDHA